MVTTLFFNVSRRFGFNIFQNYVPSSLTTIISWISFWIKKDSTPARTSLGKWVWCASTWAQNCLLMDPFSSVIYGSVSYLHFCVFTGLTSVLTMTTLGSYSQQNFPHVSYITALDFYITTCFIFCFCALMEFAVLNFLTYHHMKTRGSPRLHHV